jgi:glycosyltransferase involved in cell wall biosynthesis
MNGKTALFVYFNPSSASIRGNRNGQDLLDLLHRINRLSQLPIVSLLARSGYEPSDLLEARASLTERNPPILCEGSSPVDAFRECLDTVWKGYDTFVSIPLAAALLPFGAVDRMLLHHRDRKGGCVAFERLPRDASPVVFSRRAAEKMLELAARKQAQGDPTGDLRKALWDAMGGRADPVCNWENIDAVANLGIDRSRVTSDVDVSSVRAVNRLRRLHAQLRAGHPAEEDPMSFAYAWKLECDRDSGSLTWERRRARPSTGRKSILYISQYCAYSGAEESLCKMISALTPGRYDLHALVGMGGDFADHLQSLGVNTVVAGESFSGATVENTRIVNNIVVQTHADIVHINSNSGMPAVFVPKLLQRQCVYHLRLAIFPEGLVEILCGVDRVLSVSRFCGNRAIAKGVRPERVSVLYDGVDTDFFAPPTDQARKTAKLAMGLDQDKVCVLMIARYERRKRHDLLIQAIAQMRNPERIQLLLVGESYGDAHYDRRVEELLRKTGVERLTLRGGFTNDVRTVEAAADVAVLCSDDEPLGTFILESMSMGRAVVVSRDSGLAELVGPNDCGVLVSNGNANELSAAIDALVSDAALRSELGARAREVCLDQCRLSLCGAAMENVYESLPLC